MIPIKKEPKELYKEFKAYETCKFCRKETDTWHEKTNTPICKDCAKSHKVADLQLLAITSGYTPLNLYFNNNNLNNNKKGKFTIEQ